MRAKTKANLKPESKIKLLWNACVCEREREKERGREGERERERELSGMKSVTAMKATTKSSKATASREIYVKYI